MTDMSELEQLKQQLADLDTRVSEASDSVERKFAVWAHAQAVDVEDFLTWQARTTAIAQSTVTGARPDEVPLLRKEIGEIAAAAVHTIRHGLLSVDRDQIFTEGRDMSVTFQAIGRQVVEPFGAAMTRFGYSSGWVEGYAPSAWKFYRPQQTARAQGLRVIDEFDAYEEAVMERRSAIRERERVANLYSKRTAADLWGA